MSNQVAILLDQLPPYQGNQRMVTRRQDTFDIIRQMLKKHGECTDHYDQIAKEHWKGSVPATAKHLYDFLKYNVPYKVEPTLKQTTKTPAAILSERTTFGNDCKHYASYIIGVGEALARQGYPVKSFYRFASYNKKRRTPGHVFAVFVHDGKEIWIDPVPEIGGYNNRSVSPCYHTDKLPPMSKHRGIGSLYDISGVADNVAGPYGRHWLDQQRGSAHMHAHRGGMHHRSPLMAHRDMSGITINYDMVELKPGHEHHHHHHHGGRVMQHPGHGGPKHHVHWLDTMPGGPAAPHPAAVGKGKKKKHKGLHIKIKAPHIKIQPGKLLKKLVGAAPRNAFMGLVKLNVFNLAVQMHNKIKKIPANWKKLHDFWEKKLGGNMNKLSTAIDMGVKTHNKLHPHAKVSGDLYEEYQGYAVNGYCGIGTPLAIPALLAAAAPVIAAIKSLLKSFGVSATDQAGAAADDADQQAADTHNDATTDKGDGNADVNPDGSVDHGEGVSTKVTKDPDTGQQTVEYKVKDPTAGGGTDNTGGGTSSAPGGDSDGGGDDQGGGDDDEDKETTKTKTKTVVKHGAGGGGFAAMFSNVTDFVKDHKMWFIGGGVLLLSVIILPKIFHHKPKRRR